MSQQGEVADCPKNTGHPQNLDQPLSLKEWLTINAISGLGVLGLENLINNEIPLSAVAKGDAETLHALGLPKPLLYNITHPNNAQIEADLEWLNSNKNHTIITQSDPQYPPLLREIHRAPLLLYCEGNVELLSESLLAIVGSRAFSHYGQHNARSFAEELVKCGWGIVSGLALGIDSFAHQGCLNAGGRTVAVLGTGIKQQYPKRNKALRERILDNEGCVVSELSVDCPPIAGNFPRRNRIISGMSYGTLVVEALLRSGSLITAKYAMEQNREVFALPGNINNPRVQGCHQLIKNGAKLVESVADINEEFLFLLQSVAAKPSDPTQKKSNESLASDQLLASVDYEATCLDVVVQRSRLPVSEVTAKLLEYELRGLVASVPGGYIRLGE